MVFPLEITEDGRGLCAVTCITPGSVSPPARERRRKFKDQRRIRAETRRAGRNPRFPRS
jgi:hypothetical protein